jgi:hypothetical protein
MIFVIRWVILFGSAVGVIRLHIVGSFMWSYFCWIISCGCLFVSFMYGFEVRTLGRGFLEGNFCTVES